MTRLAKETSADRIADLLRSAILRGEFPAGSLLCQKDLALELGVSRIPLREALRRLEGEDLLTPDPYRGSRVTAACADEALDAAQTRQHIELYAFDLARELHDASSIELCRARIDEPAAESDWGFHEALYAPARRPYLLSFARDCARRVDLFLRASRIRTGNAMTREHRSIIAAMSEENFSKARDLLDQHLANDIARIRSSLGV